MSSETYDSTASATYEAEIPLTKLTESTISAVYGSSVSLETCDSTTGATYEAEKSLTKITQSTALTAKSGRLINDHNRNSAIYITLPSDSASSPFFFYKFPFWPLFSHKILHNYGETFYM